MLALFSIGLTSPHSKFRLFFFSRILQNGDTNFNLHTDIATISQYSETSVHERPCSRTIRFTNKFSEKKQSRMTNTEAGNSGKLRVSARECLLLVNFGSVHIPACIRRAFS
jgi:hypothetical protein